MHIMCFLTFPVAFGDVKYAIVLLSCLRHHGAWLFHGAKIRVIAGCVPVKCARFKKVTVNKS